MCEKEGKWAKAKSLELLMIICKLATNRELSTIQMSMSVQPVDHDQEVKTEINTVFHLFTRFQPPGALAGRPTFAIPHIAAVE